MILEEEAEEEKKHVSSRSVRSKSGDRAAVSMGISFDAVHN